SPWLLNWAGLTKTDTTTTSAIWRARRINSKCPSWSEPIVGTKAMVLLSRRTLRANEAIRWRRLMISISSVRGRCCVYFGQRDVLWQAVRFGLSGIITGPDIVHPFADRVGDHAADVGVLPHETRLASERETD